MTGAAQLERTTFIHRVNTQGGVAPAQRAPGEGM